MLAETVKSFKAKNGFQRSPGGTLGIFGWGSAAGSPESPAYTRQKTTNSAAILLLPNLS